MWTLPRWLAAWASLGMLVGWASRAWAADSPAAAPAAPTSTAVEHLDLTYIPAEAVSVIVAHPQAVLMGPDAEWIPVEVITAAGMKEFGIDPLKIKEAVVLFAPPTSGADPDVAAVVRFSEAYSKAAVTAKLAGREKSVNGKTVVELPGPRLTWLHLPDDKTIVIGTAPLVEKMLAAKGAESPLLNLLQKVDVTSHLTAIFSIDAVRPIMKQAVAAAPPVPPQLQDFLKLPDLLSAILLRVNVGEKFTANLTLRAQDEAAAQETERIVNQGLVMARQMVMAQIASMPRAQNDPVQEALIKYLTRITDKMFSSLKLAREGQTVSISIETGSSFATIGVLAGLLLPAVQASGSVFQRVQSEQNMKQIGLALFNFETVNHRFPARAIFDKQGKPLLSWRVQILPFVEQTELFKQFHLDEPWDSEHNKALIAKMPGVFRSPHRPPDEKTPFLAPVGKGLAFEGQEGLPIASFTDGTSNTIMLVEANDDQAVIWTKPDDLDVDLAKPMTGLGDAEPNGFAVLVADGSVRLISKRVDAELLKKLFTRNGGEVIDFNQLDR